MCTETPETITNSMSSGDLDVGRRFCPGFHRTINRGLEKGRSHFFVKGRRKGRGTRFDGELGLGVVVFFLLFWRRGEGGGLGGGEE